MKQGFTLIELLVVIGLIILLSVMALPLFNLFTQGQGVQLAYNLVYMDVMKARQLAITKRTNYYLFFDKDHKLPCGGKPGEEQTQNCLFILREESNPRNNTLELNEDKVEGEPDKLPTFVGYYEGSSVFGNTSDPNALAYFGFRSDGTLFFPPGIQGVDPDAFAKDPTQCDIGLVYPNKKPRQGVYMVAAEITGRLSDHQFADIKPNQPVTTK